MTLRWIVPAVSALALVLLAVAPATRAPVVLSTQTVALQASPSPTLPSNDELLFRIRRQFRSHRPPPAYETYTITRAQNTNYGVPDPLDSYSFRVWCRTYDDACMERHEYRLGAHGPLRFKRPMFNIADDPGPPTADVFQPAPAHSLPPTFVPTPEPTGPLPKTIAEVHVLGEFDYRVTAARIENGELHVSVLPKRNPNRNRLREIYVDPKTYELKRLVATDKLFVTGDPDSPYLTIFTITMSHVHGRLVVSKIRGVVKGGYLGDGQKVLYTFTHITFPVSLPSWYFDSRTYAAHAADAPL